MAILSLRRRKSDGVYFCRACGWRVDDQKKPWKSTCPQCEELKKLSWKPILIGDVVEKVLTSVGITKNLVTKLTRSQDKPGGCGCAARQKWLNEVGLRVQDAAKKAVVRAKLHYLP